MSLDFGSPACPGPWVEDGQTRSMAGDPESQPEELSRPAPSRLVQYLNGQLGEALLESSGGFTLARERAVEKLAAFQLPRPESWILKLIQALVAGGTCNIDIRLRARETELGFSLALPWSLEQVEEAFWDPEISDVPSLDHLKRGLWNVAIRQGRPFQLSLSGWTQALIWTGQELRRLPISWDSASTLTLSCRQAGDRSRNSAAVNAETLLEVQQHAFVCSVPLVVDGRRIDALQIGPHHGYHPQTIPIVIATATSSLQTLEVPPGTWEDPRPAAISERQPEKLTRRKVGCRGPISVAGIIALHAHRIKDGSWAAGRTYSHFFWVRDGVVVHTEGLNQPEPLSVSCGVFASALGMSSDLTGFTLMDQDEMTRRRSTACQAWGRIWPTAQWALEYLNRGGSIQERRGLLKLVKSLLTTPFALLLFGFNKEFFPEQLRDLERLRGYWPEVAQAHGSVPVVPSRVAVNDDTK